jgi:hypothetical protein
LLSALLLALVPLLVLGILATAEIGIQSEMAIALATAAIGYGLSRTKHFGLAAALSMVALATPSMSAMTGNFGIRSEIGHIRAVPGLFLPVLKPSFCHCQAKRH